MIRRSTIAVATAAGLAVLAGGGLTIAASSADDDPPDVPLSGDDLARASAAALAHTGEGQVTGSEIGDEDSYYEIEVTLDDGRQVDVQLDRDFAVVGSSADDTAGDSDD